MNNHGGLLIGLCLSLGLHAYLGYALLKAPTKSSSPAQLPKLSQGVSTVEVELISDISSVKFIEETQPQELPQEDQNPIEKDSPPIIPPKEPKDSPQSLDPKEIVKEPPPLPDPPPSIKEHPLPYLEKKETTSHPTPQPKSLKDPEQQKIVIAEPPPKPEPKRSQRLEPLDIPPKKTNQPSSVEASSIGIKTDAIPPKKIVVSYPKQCKRRGHEGTFKFKVRVNKRGIVTSMLVLESNGCARLEKEARRAIQQATFTPARDGFKAVASEVIVPIEFVLKKQ